METKCDECNEVHDMIWIGMFHFMCKYECSGCGEINYIDDGMYDE
jgi:hypothetical protein